MSKLRFVRAAAGLLAAIAACSCGPVSSRTSPAVPPPTPDLRAPRNGLEVIGWMRYAHPSRDLKSLSFTVTTTQYRADSSRLSRSRVHVALPGKVRVGVLPANSRSGYVRDRQRVAVFERGRRVSSLSRVDLSTLLAYDVFAQSVDTTIMWLDTARVRFGLLRSDELEGRDVWVVGAPAGDTTSEQFWIDARRWRVLRVIQREARTPSVLSDIRFAEYAEFLDVPVPTRIEVRRGGRVVERQEIGEFAINPALPSRTFSLSRWANIE